MGYSRPCAISSSFSFGSSLTSAPTALHHPAPAALAALLFLRQARYQGLAVTMTSAYNTSLRCKCDSLSPSGLCSLKPEYLFIKGLLCSSLLPALSVLSPLCDKLCFPMCMLIVFLPPC